MTDAQRENMRKTQRERRARFRASGMCARCGVLPRKPGISLCEKHHEAAKKDSSRWYKRRGRHLRALQAEANKHV